MNTGQREMLEEAFRFGITCSEKLLKFLEDNTNKVLSEDLKTLEDLSLLLAQVSSSPVGEKAKSFGKLIEAILISSGYPANDATSLGILKQVQISRHLGFCSIVTLNRIARSMTNYGFTTRMNMNLLLGSLDTYLGEGMHTMALIFRPGEFELLPVNYLYIRLLLESEIVVIPSGPISGTVTVPGSKSISNRVLLMAALGEGPCTIQGLLDSDDIQVMLQSLTQLGVNYEWTKEGNELTVFGCAGQFKRPTKELYLNNSGTSARFLTSAVCLVENGENETGVVNFETEIQNQTILTGNPRMRERPIGPLVTALQSNGCRIRYMETIGCLPIAVDSVPLSGGTIEIEGKVSSQFVSSILISGPYAQAPLILQLAEESPVSLPYILMTMQLMQDFGIPAKFYEPNKFEIPKGVYTNPANYIIEPDASSATYLLAMAAITGGEIIVRHLGCKSLQGDAKFYEVLQDMGCTAVQNASETMLRGPKDQRLQAVHVNMETLTDAFMTIAVLAAVAIGRTEIRGIANQRVKECNRIAVMVEELKKLGVQCDELEDGLWIEGVNDLSEFKTPSYINCHDDHRIALSFAVLGSKIPGIVILDKDCTSKTYPGFWDNCHSMQVALRPGSDFTNIQNYAPIYLVGMRGCGKTTFGKRAAAALGLSFLCMDYFLEAQFGKTIKSFVAENGMAAFRAEEEKLLRRIVDAKLRNIIISCGGGLVEVLACLEILTGSDYVVNIERPWSEVKRLLEQDDTRAVLPDDLEVLWARRRPLYEACSSHKFKNSESEPLDKSISAFVELLEKIRGHTQGTECLDLNPK